MLALGLAMAALWAVGCGANTVGSATPEGDADAAAAADVGASEAGTGGRPKPQLREIRKGFVQPTQVIGAPDSDRLFVVEKRGRIRMIEGDGVRTVLSIGSKVRASGIEQGLLSMAFVPGFEDHRQVVLVYITPQQAVRVSQFRMAPSGVINPKSERRVFTVPQQYPTHNGGHALTGPDGRIYVGFGDGGSVADPFDNGQNPRTRKSTIAAFSVNGARLERKPQTVAIGLRNPWRMSFDRENGDLWLGDVGQETIEEINHIPARQFAAASGKYPMNFGWSIREGDRKFKDTPRGPGKLIGPTFQYTHDEGCSVTGGVVYRGAEFPRMQGWYLYADYCREWLGALRLGSDGAVADRVRPAGVGGVSSFGEDRNGEVFAVSLTGSLYRLVDDTGDGDAAESAG